jgi:2-polyprenyl-6-methoxyphenol hydroxylase-like FAD-dependent oxidoreductase
MNCEHAIIIGGGMSGLMAARVLSNHFQRVTIIERDSLPTEAEARGGVPQGRHLHLLLVRGRQIINRLFPGIEDDLDAAGVPTIDFGTQYVGLTSGGWLKPYAAGRVGTRCVSRPLLEFLVRKHLMQNPAVIILERTDVDDLVSDYDKTHVLGVQVTSRVDHARQVLQADLVVDCSGRNSKGPEWLQQMGYGAPTETKVDSQVSYTTRWYEAKTNAKWVVLTISGRPAKNLRRGGGIMLVEGDRWVVTLAGVNGDHAPHDEDGFLAYAKSLASPAIYHTIKEARPLSPIIGFRYHGSRIRHYEKLTRRPERLILLGDAVCSFNPIYGQGMTVAALEVELLERLLATWRGESLDGFASAFQQAVPMCTQDAWLLATGEDLRYPGTIGKRPNALMRMVQVYTDWALEATALDSEAAVTFSRVVHLVERPSALFKPHVLWAVLRSRFANRQSGASHVPDLLLAPR